jgi:flavin reductase (DIM6/NTAB) family NADH-FMN oxidoreductase RutF
MLLIVLLKLIKVTTMIIDPTKIPTADLHQYLLGSVAPRPIALASTIDENGIANVAPYSFFNAFSSNPPILVFSSNRKVKDNTTKDTLHNIENNKEVVINVVSHDILRQMALSSVAFGPTESEFVKAGFTPLASDLVKPFRVKESPVQMECKVQDIIALGTHGGAGHLIICRVVRMHIDDRILDENHKIDPQKIDLMGRLGRAFYARASGDAVMKVYQNVGKIPLGYDQIPEYIKSSTTLSANDVARIAGQLMMPTDEMLSAVKVEYADLSKSNDIETIHKEAKSLIADDAVEKAFALLLSSK